MGSSYSTHHTNLGKESTLFDSSATSTLARWGDAFSLSMGNWKENNDNTEVWGVEYKTKQSINTEKLVCGFQLKVNRDNTGVESIYFGIRDSSSENETKFSLKITRVARDGLSGGIIDIDSSFGGAPVSFTRAEKSCTIETNVVSYYCTNREGLFVLETKKKVSSENAYAVTLAHYYITQSFGLSVTAKICRNKNCYGFDVELEGPIKHPFVELSKVLAKTCRTGIWYPNLCSHCSNNIKGKSQIYFSQLNSSEFDIYKQLGVNLVCKYDYNNFYNQLRKKSTVHECYIPNNNNIRSKRATGVSENPSLMLKATTPIRSNHEDQEGEDEVVSQVVKQAMLSSNVEVQYNKGLINSTGNISGFLNNCIIFMNYKLPNLD